MTCKYCGRDIVRYDDYFTRYKCADCRRKQVRATLRAWRNGKRECSIVYASGEMACLECPLDACVYDKEDKMEYVNEIRKHQGEIERRRMNNVPDAPVRESTLEKVAGIAILDEILDAEEGVCYVDDQEPVGGDAVPGVLVSAGA